MFEQELMCLVVKQTEVIGVLPDQPQRSLLGAFHGALLTAYGAQLDRETQGREDSLQVLSNLSAYQFRHEPSALLLVFR